MQRQRPRGVVIRDFRRSRNQPHFAFAFLGSARGVFIRDFRRTRNEPHFAFLGRPKQAVDRRRFEVERKGSVRRHADGRCTASAALIRHSFIGFGPQESVFRKWPKELQQSLTEYRRLQDSTRTPQAGLGAYQSINKHNLSYGTLCRTLGSADASSS